MVYLLVKHDKNFIKKSLIGLFGAYFLLFGTLILVLKTGERSTDIVMRGILILTVASTFVSCAWAARKTSAYKKLWLLMAIGMFFWTVGEVIFFIYVVKYGIAHVPRRTIADYFSIAYLPMTIGVMDQVPIFL